MTQLNVIRVLKFGTVAAVLALSGLAAQAQGHRGGPGGHGMMFDGPGIGRVLEAVDATDAQRAQIKQIMQAAHNDLKAQQESGRKLREQGLTLFAAPNVDAAALESLRQQIQVQHEVVSKRMGQAMVEAARVLTPEQRAKFADQMKKREARAAEHMRERGASKPSK